MKVLLYSAGFVEYIIELANALVNNEQVSSLHLLLPKNKVQNFYVKELDPRIKLHTIDFVHYVSLRKNFKMTRKLIGIINEINPDILHVQADGQHPWFGWVLPFIKKKCKIINTVHDPKPHVGDKISVYRDMRFSKWMLKKYADVYIVHGKTLKEELIEAYKIKPEKVHIISHGNLYVYRHFQISGKKEENPFSVLFFGRIWEYKGLKYLMQAEPFIKKAIPDFKIVIAGTGEELSLYDKYMINKDSYIIKNYRIPLEEVADLFDEAAFVVLPYIEATQSGVIPVAYPFEKTVVASEVGALPEVIIDGLTGYLVPPANPEALAEKIIFLLKNPEIRKEMGQNAKKYSDENLDWEKIAFQTLKVYKNC